jgi:Undecaprenyl-phosphate glucose phosphotransferase
MLKEKRQLFEAFFMGADIITACIAWCMAYWMRFESGLFALDKGVPDFSDYSPVLLVIAPVWGLVFRIFGLYKPMRGVRELRERELLVYANTMALLLVITLVYLFREKTVPYSRAVFLWFGALVLLSTAFERGLLRYLLRDLRRKGYNLRYMLVVGGGKVAQDLIRRVRSNKELGIQLLGLVTCTGEQQEMGQGVPIVGGYSRLSGILQSLEVDQVVIALPLNEVQHLPAIMDQISDTIVDVKIVPDLYQFVRLGGSIEEFEGLPVIGVQGSPLEGLAMLLKRGFDIVTSLALIIFLFPLLVVIGVIVKLTSSGPMIYVQERVSLDGSCFPIFKFRTMSCNAERGGPGWTRPNDARVTFFGKFLRRTSLDELPQLFNVLRGDMSIVGPRPERPVYIKEFKKRIPGYMLRHKVPAGITGWAQVNGWRGDTSIDKRIEFDLHYIENWSLMMDLKILLMTLVWGLFGRNAY